jgi:hypothetical protein
MTKEDVMERYKDKLSKIAEEWWFGIFEEEIIKESRSLKGVSIMEVIQGIKRDVSVQCPEFWSSNGEERLLRFLKNDSPSCPDCEVELVGIHIERNPSGVYARPSFFMKATKEKWSPVSVPPGSFWKPCLEEVKSEETWLYEIPLDELRPELRLFRICGPREEK